MAKRNIFKNRGKTYIFSNKGGGGQSGITVTPLTVTENGVYTSAEDQAYSPVTVRVEGDVEVEDNKPVSISENGTVVINPTSGKDAMAKVTATVNVTPVLETKTITENGTYTPAAGKDGFSEVVVNVSGGGDSGSATAYAWKSTSNDSFILYLNMDKALDSSSDIKILYPDGEGCKVSGLETYLAREGLETTYTKVSDSQFQILWEGTDPEIFERDSEGDVIIWKGEGGGNTTAYAWHGYFEDLKSPHEMDIGILHFDFSSAPATQSDFESGNRLLNDEGLNVVKNGEYFPTITKYSVSEEGVIYIITEGGLYHFVRDSSKDLSIWEASGDITVESLSVTENGTYTAPAGKAYSPVTVNVAGGGSGSVPLYAWSRYDSEAGEDYYVYTLSTTPSVNDDVYIGTPYQEIRKNYSPVGSYSNNEITVGADTYARNNAKDIILQAGEGSKQLYIYHYEQGSDSLLCEASSFENITVGMKGVLSSSASEYMTGVTCTEKTAESATFRNDNYRVTIASSDIPTSLSSILD